MIVKLPNFLYRNLLMLLTIDAALFNTTISDGVKQPIHDFCLYAGIVLALLCIISKKYNYKILILNIILFVFAIVSYRVSGNSDILMSILLVALAWKMDVDEILNEIFEIRLAVFIFTILLALIGILDTGVIADVSADKGVKLGYGHANTFAGSAGILILLMFAINRRKIKKSHICIATLADIITFYFSRSRTALFLITFAIILILICEFSKKFSINVREISLYVLPAYIVYVD